MNLDEMQSTWQTQNIKLDRILQINKQQMYNKKFDGFKDDLKQLKIMRCVEGIIFFALLVTLWTYIANSWAFTAPVISAVALTVFAIIGLAGNIGQIALLSQVDFSQSIKQVQQQLFSIRSHNLAVFKLLALSLPFYMAYVFLGFEVLLNVDLFLHLSTYMLFFYGTTSLLMLIAVLKLLSEIKHTNRHKKWVNWCYQEFGGKKLSTVLNALDDFRAC